MPATTRHDEESMGKGTASGGEGYDVLFVSTPFAEALNNLGLVTPIDHAKVPNLANLYPEAAALAYDPGNTFSVPYTWGTTGFTYNVRMLRERMPDAPVDSAAMLFAPEVASRFADCGISLLDEASTVVPLVMLYLGHDPHSIDPADLAEAEAVLKSVRPHVRYISSVKALNDLPNREICVAMTWS